MSVGSQNTTKPKYFGDKFERNGMVCAQARTQRLWSHIDSSVLFLDQSNRRETQMILL